MADINRNWNERYLTGDLPWDSGRPSQELQRVLAEVPIPRGRALDLGCGSGTNAVWLAQQGYDVTAVDISPVALAMARQKAEAAGVTVHFIEGSVEHFGADLPPMQFIFDRGCYHCCRGVDLAGYLETLQNVSQPGTWMLCLAGNANEGVRTGPPQVTEQEVRNELGQVFSIVQLREFHFDEADGSQGSLGWSILLKRT